MASTPNGSVVDEINSVEDGPPPPKGAGKDDRGERRTSLTPTGHCGDRDPSSGAGGMRSCGGYDPDFLGPPNPIDQLVAALHDAGSTPTPNAGSVMDLIQTQIAMMMEEDLESKSLPPPNF